MPELGRRLGGDLGGHERVAVAGKQHHGGRPGRLDRLEQLPGRGPPARAGGHHDGTGLAQQGADPRAGGARDDSQRRRVVAGVDLAGEVGDPDPLRAAGGHARLDGRARVVDVHVHVPQVGAADDEQRVAERVEGRPQGLDRFGGGVGEQVHHLVGRPLAVAPRSPRSSGSCPGSVGEVGCGRRRHGIRRAPLVATVQRGPGRQQPVVGGRPAPGDDPVEGLEHEHAAGAAGVDDPGAGERLELVGGAGQRLLGGVDGGLAHVGERATGLGGLDRGGGTGIRDGEDGALLRVRDARAGRGRAGGERVGEQQGVDHLGLALDDGVAQAADQLADDDPGVAPGRQQDGPLEGAALLHQGGLAQDAGVLVRGDDLVDGGVEGEVEVGAGVAVGHREDVEARRSRCGGPRAPHA